MKHSQVGTHYLYQLLCAFFECCRLIANVEDTGKSFVQQMEYIPLYQERR